MAAAAHSEQGGGGDVLSTGPHVLAVEVARGVEQFRVHLALSQQSLRCLSQQVATVLHPREQSHYSSLLADARRHSFLLGRQVAKLALLGGRENGPGLRLPDIEIAFGVFRQPVVRCAGLDGRQISISHSHQWGAALAFPEEHPMGIDVERIDESGRLASLVALSASEAALLTASPLTEGEGHTLCWTVKEALSKVLKTGLTVDFRLLEVGKLFVHPQHIECHFANFPQYRAVSWLWAGFAWSAVLPRNSRIEVDSLISRLHEHVAAA